MEQRWATSGSVLRLPALPSLPRQAVTFALPPSAVSSGEPILPQTRCPRAAGKGLPHQSAACTAPGPLCCCLPSAQACSPVGSGCLALPVPAGAAFSLGLSPPSSMLQPCPGVCRQGECRQEPASTAPGPPQPELVGAGSRRGQQGACAGWWVCSSLTPKLFCFFSLSPHLLSVLLFPLSPPASSLSCSYESSAEILPHTPRLTHFPTVSGSPASLADSMQQKLSCPRRRRQQSPSAM